MKSVKHGIQAGWMVLLLVLGMAGATVRTRAATLVEIAAGNPDFSTLVAAVQAAGLVETLAGPGPLTVFAPNNAAFAKLPPGTVEGLLADPAKLRQVLLYHVVPGRRTASTLTAGPLVTVQGAAARLTLEGGVKIDAATVLAPDVIADNGVIHVIDTVILPPVGLVELVAGNPDFSTLLAAVQAAGLADFFAGAGPYTVFAPNNAAFAKLPAGTVEGLLADPARLRQVLLYHVVRSRVRSTDLVAGAVPTVQGAAVRVNLTGGVKVNDSGVIAPDVEAANGVVHVIDSVLLPPPDLVAVAAANPDFSTLVTALQAAGLVDALKASGPFTVFAPNNAAFAKLPAGTIEALLADTNRLRHILLYHVHSGPRVRAGDLRAGTLSTLQGAPLQVSLAGGARINQAGVLATDVEALNGVIHVIDEVILPGGGFGLEDLQLSVVVLGGEATVVWPAREGVPPVLESAPAPAGPWSAVTAPVVVADGIRKVTVPSTAENQFFRLRR
jgi:transforming growth factor-beta-induced protein